MDLEVGADGFAIVRASRIIIYMETNIGSDAGPAATPPRQKQTPRRAAGGLGRGPDFREIQEKR